VDDQEGIVKVGKKMLKRLGYNEEKANGLGIKAFLMKPIIQAELSKITRQVLDTR
jgi:hypothetical protein